MDGDRECIVVIRDEMHNQGHKLQGGVVVTNGGVVMGGCNVNSAYLHVSVYLNDSAVSGRTCVYVVKLCICMCPHPYPKTGPDGVTGVTGEVGELRQRYTSFGCRF